ncbi:hypothetical protein HETIRDRAFT_101525 [Heterobasidion irregulare TC 32-1]|uniref:Uncharacterized protein n=1 Tax=Heterobasidion irregulare (strain TC 32-1) TaxID=747525 RepID=W4K5Q4_HETIT|nr:uncharacterized protein HETIRDRAFT_101525 [Heterobasidion irregulare TC 32-1]ETW80361.1 hypothetical protein HETIRDRAFT_101525 [Heterobasidion irregulare TC 32-1]
MPAPRTGNLPWHLTTMGTMTKVIPSRLSSERRGLPEKRAHIRQCRRTSKGHTEDKGDRAVDVDVDASACGPEKRTGRGRSQGSGSYKAPLTLPVNRSAPAPAEELNPELGLITALGIRTGARSRLAEHDPVDLSGRRRIADELRAFDRRWRNKVDRAMAVVEREMPLWVLEEFTIHEGWVAPPAANKGWVEDRGGKMPPFSSSHGLGGSL